MKGLVVSLLLPCQDKGVQLKQVYFNPGPIFKEISLSEQSKHHFGNGNEKAELRRWPVETVDNPEGGVSSSI